jgi:Tfp pilus assembly protein PilO
MPYIQTNLKLTISQYHYLRELTAGMDSDSRRLFIENLGLKPRRSTTALLLNMSIVYEIYARM